VSYSCSILADSYNPAAGTRLTTFEITFPRFLLAEVNTHRMLSRNSASSRAIPTERMIGLALAEPFVPEFNKRVTGMGVGEPLSSNDQFTAQQLWLDARDSAVEVAQQLLHVDKSRANRLLEPFLWHTSIVSGTDWSNFFALRTPPDAQPEFQTIAKMMLSGYENNDPAILNPGEWHLPLVFDDDVSEPWAGELPWDYWPAVSSGRCARVSFDRHHDDELVSESRARCQKLTSGHWSPLEHPAVALERDERIGNYRGFKQYRKFFENEDDAAKLNRC
jgi:hypothetical protein